VPRSNHDTRIGELEARLAEALEHKHAIAEILRVISGSPTNLQPVLDAVAERAAHLCKSPFARVMMVDGDVLLPTAQYSLDGRPQPKADAVPLQRTSISGRAAVDRATVHHADIVPLLDTEFPGARDNALREGFRAILAVPLMREGSAYGALFLYRSEPGLFSPEQVTLLQTFAEQISIAVDNVRLFTELGARNRELTEALEQQTATSEILRVISSSPTDVQPVFDIIAESAVRLCGAETSLVSQLDGDLIRLTAISGINPEGIAVLRRNFPMPVAAESVTARCIRSRDVENVADVQADPAYGYKDLSRVTGFRGSLGVPMIREGQVIGAIFVARDSAGRFSDPQVELLRTFADQAVIAIENVRLFTELGARNRELTEALEQQIATSEILRVISQSQTDVQPVFDTIAAGAQKLCGAAAANVFTFDRGPRRGTPPPRGRSWRAAPLRFPTCSRIPITRIRRTPSRWGSAASRRFP
jgi:two-component system NtrC family sensor kinase